MGTTYGYVRVSTREQNEDRQMVALEQFNVPAKNIFMDKQSGKDFNRPAYKKLIKKLKQGDLLVMKSIDRLGRDYEEIMEQWRIITKQIGADIKVLDMPLLDTTYGKDLLGTFIADLVLQVMSFTAQMERENTLQRQAEGIAAAKARGVQFGKKPKALPRDFGKLYHRWQSGEISVNELASICNMSKTTLYKNLREYEEAYPGGYQIDSGNAEIPGYQ